MTKFLIPGGKGFFFFLSSVLCPDQLWGPPSLLFSGGNVAGCWSWPLTST